VLVGFDPLLDAFEPVVGVFVVQSQFPQQLLTDFNLVLAGLPPDRQQQLLLLLPKEPVVVLGDSVFEFAFVEVVHVELIGVGSTWRWKEVRLECLK
jgi:hypothetical protein